MTAKRKTKNTKHTRANTVELGDDLQITKMTRRASGGGTWVIGTIAGHKFNALAFPDHAECPDYELGESRISKLWIQQLADKAEVANFDRGWDHRPANPIAAKIVDFLAAGLAECVYNK